MVVAGQQQSWLWAEGPCLWVGVLELGSESWGVTTGEGRLDLVIWVPGE